MGEARGYLELRGELTNELGRDRNTGPIAIQIICPSTPVGGQPPRVSYTAIPDSIGFEEIGIVQR